MSIISHIGSYILATTPSEERVSAVHSQTLVSGTPSEATVSSVHASVLSGGISEVRVSSENAYILTTPAVIVTEIFVSHVSAQILGNGPSELRASAVDTYALCLVEPPGLAFDAIARPKAEFGGAPFRDTECLSGEDTITENTPKPRSRNYVYQH